MTSVVEGDGWSAPRPGRFSPGEDPVPIVQGAGWAPGPVWTCAKNLASTRIFFPNPILQTFHFYCTASTSLYRIHSPTLGCHPLVHTLNESGALDKWFP